MSLLRLNAAGSTHVGMRRKQNQDHYLIASDLRLFIVADGMGGHQGGETASNMAVLTIEASLRQSVTANTSEHHLNAPARLQQAIQHANRAIQLKGQDEPELQGMGTTTTVLYFGNETLYIGHVGDSRTYLVHPNRIWQVTRDHSLVQEKLRAGLITRSQLKTDRMKNVITRSVGFENDVEVDIYHVTPHPGDAFVICSDGLSGMLEDAEIQKIVRESLFQNNSAQEAVDRLIASANTAGGDDNVTAVLIQVI